MFNNVTVAKSKPVQVLKFKHNTENNMGEIANICL